MRKLNERTKPVGKQVQFKRAEGITHNDSFDKKQKVEADTNKDRPRYLNHNTPKNSGSSPKQIKQDKSHEYETQRIPETPPKQIQHDKNDNDKTWSPPSSQKRISLDVLSDKLDNGRLKSPTKSTLRLPSTSPLRRSSATSPSKKSLDDPFDLARIADEVFEELFAGQTTGNGSTLSSTEWSAVNRRQPMRLGSFSEAGTDERTQTKDSSIPATQRPSQIAPSLDPRTATRPEETQAGEGSPKKRVSTDDDYSATNKRQRIAESLSDNPSEPPRTMVLTVNTAGTENTRQKQDIPRREPESTPADLTDSIRTAC